MLIDTSNISYGARFSWKFDKHIHIDIFIEAFRSNIKNISWWGEFSISWFLLLQKSTIGSLFLFELFCTNSYKRLTVNVTADVQFGLGTLMNITNLIMYFWRLLYEFALTFGCNWNCWRTIWAWKFKLRLTSYFNMVPHNRRFWN